MDEGTRIPDEAEATTGRSSERLLAVGEVVQRLSVSRSKVYELLATNRLRAIKLDGRRLIIESSIDDLIQRELSSDSIGSAD